MNCTICYAKFESTSQLIYHSTMKHPFERRISCPICNVNLKSSTALGGHLNFGHPVIKLKRLVGPDNVKKKCQICNKDIPDKDKMLPHIKGHAAHGGIFNANLI